MTYGRLSPLCLGIEMKSLINFFKNFKKNMFEANIKMVRRMIIIAPIELLLACEKLDIEYPDVEFSILTSIEKIEEEKIYLKSEYYIPKQKVSSVAIMYGQDEKADLYDVVIHKHPEGCLEFSQKDEEYINKNHTLSILYTRNEGFVNERSIKSGVYNVKLSEGVMLPVPIEIRLDYINIDVKTENISEEETITLLPVKTEMEKAVTKEYQSGLKTYPNSGFSEEHSQIQRGYSQEYHEKDNNEFGYYDKFNKFHSFQEIKDGVLDAEGIQLCEKPAKELIPFDLTCEEWQLKCEYSEEMLDILDQDYANLEDKLQELEKEIEKMEMELLLKQRELDRLEGEIALANTEGEML